VNESAKSNNLMSKTTCFLTTTLCLALLVQWFTLSRLKEESKKTLQKQQETEAVRSELDQALENGANFQKAAEASSLEVKDLQQKLEHLASTRALTPTNPEPLAVAPPSTPKTLVLTTENIDPASISVIGDDHVGNLIVKLLDTSIEELQKLLEEETKVIVGQIVTTNRPGFVLVNNRTEILLVFQTRKEAEKAAAFLLGKDVLK